MRPYREAIVLAGGFGTRLAHVVPDVCKPMAPVAGRPFLRFIMDQLAAAGFDRAVVADGYRREQIEDFFGSAYRGMAIEYSPEDTPLFTGGAVKRALGRCQSDWVFVLNGDTWLDFDFAALEAVVSDAPEDASAVIAVKRMHDFERYGTVDVDADGTLTAFHEKRPCEEGLINAGVYLLRRHALDNMPDKFSLESDYFECVVGNGSLCAVECTGGFIDIGVPEDYKLAQTMLAPLAKSWKLAMFDRDGTINVDIGHLHEPEKLELIPSTVDIMRGYTDDPDYKVVVVTNQAGIAKGLYTEADMRRLHRYMEDELEKLGVHVDAWYFCPHHPDYTGPCDCRKPAPGMLLAAMRDFDAMPIDCVMYGDAAKDKEAAAAGNVVFHYVKGNNYGE
ncbi:HAD-IIIA family hydrolase [Collinsella sp. TM10-22]|uniref:HAD-IIIA family hydrolase n=1 Tax=Collinsella sp. TM10-22 TaxID=2292344 RepID=UPI000E4E5A06|nr:HAD-IIIA family hydrolase [Collinsella sp. TM10-22]RGI68751.1 HAD-IIIA family hydrolase [Collinsella sp. TM10-22]